MGTSTSFTAAGASGALWGALAPFSFIFIAEQTMIRDSISHETYLELIPWINATMAPGLSLADIFGSEPRFWTAHSNGALFLKDIAVLGLSNAVSWAAFFCAAAWFLGKLRAQFRSSSGTPSGLQEAGKAEIST